MIVLAGLLVFALASATESQEQQACNSGDMGGCAKLGMKYLNGEGVAKDAVRAAELFKQACDGGSATGCFNLGAVCQFGLGVPKDELRAAALFKQACDGDNMQGCFILAGLYHFGQGLPKDQVRAAALFKQACDGGNMGGCYNLGLDYATGQGVPKDEVRAVALFKQACSGGTKSGCSNLGLLSSAPGAPRDDVRAAAQYNEACTGGDMQACSLLGDLYESGQGVPNDELRAVALFKQACGGGTMRACFAMASLLERLGKVDEAEKILKQIYDANPKDANACGALAGIYNKPLWGGKSKFVQAIETLQRCAAIDVSDPQGFYKVAVLFWDEAYRDPLLNDKQKDEYADKGLESVDKALAIKPDYVEALVYKGLLLRVKAQVTNDLRLRQQYLDQAQTLARQAQELKKEQLRRACDGGDTVSCTKLDLPYASGQGAPKIEASLSAAARVGGGIKEPRKLKDVPPVYPDIAKKARVQGDVILECTISPQGQVTDVKVVQGIPLLNASAKDAVLQWVYAPTLVNGVPVPLIMTVTVGFHLH
jgi:TonB family protein